jgi:16S rRNA (cytidine1402-2'-O)-methyltransferase
MSASLYVCATPIGNLEDITLRAVRVLKECGLIAAEDTRHTKKLLDRHQIKTPLTSYHKFNIRQKTSFVLNKIKEGKSVALVSDAGMPGISDPGEELIAEAIKEGINVIPIPGPSAFVTALAVSGLSTGKFLFQGFLPSKKSERVEMLNGLRGEDATLIFYEAPHRIVETLEDMKEVLGNRNVVAAREITKKFEEFVRGNISEALTRFRASKPKGEFVLLVEGSPEKKERPDAGSLGQALKELIKLGVSKKDLVRIFSVHSGLTRNELYDMVLNIQARGSVGRD